MRHRRAPAPAHGGEPRVYAATVWAIDWTESPAFQRVWGHGERGVAYGHRDSAGVGIGDDSGAPGVYVEPWQGMWVPKGTPKDAIDKLGQAARAAMADPATRARLISLGQQIPPPEQQTAAARRKLFDFLRRHLSRS